MKKSIFKISIIIISVFAFCKSINAYTMGEKVKYKGNKYYVINDNNTSVTLLKERPLTTVEVNTYGEGHINAYSKFDDSSLEVSYEHEAVDIDGYGAIAFYQSDTCKLSDEEVSDGCKNTYIDSDIKYVIDVWAKDNVDEEDLVSDSTGYSIRLLTFDETTNYLGFEYRSNHVTLPKAYMETADTPKWVYNTSYWLMTPSEDNTKVYYMTDGGVLKESASLSPNLIRPVITLSKKSLDSKNTKKTYILNNDINEIKYGISYNIGDTIIYNDINFTVIKNSTDADDSILLIKDEPLTVDEIVKNGTGYINKAFGNPPNSVNGYGMVSYYSSDTCNHTDNSGCTNKYEDSDAKHILDTWVSNSLKNDNINILDLNARIISKSDLFDIFGYTISSASQQSSSSGPSLKYVPPVPTDYDLSYCLTSYSIFDGSISVFSGNSENIYQAKHVTYPGAICPIISIKKQFIKKDSNDIVNVPDTKLYKGFMILLSGIVIILLSIVLLFIRKKKVIVKNEKNKYCFIICTLFFAIFIEKVKAYSYGDEVTYNNMKFNVLKDNGESVTILKQTPLLANDVDYYGRGHVNMYNSYNVGYYPTIKYTKKAANEEGYGGIAFYSRKSCSNIDKNYSGCVNNYDKSDVKYVVDAWANQEFGSKNLIKDETGYSARLMTKAEIEKYYIYEYRESSPTDSTLIRVLSSETPSWLYQSRRNYWLMSSADDGNDVYNSTLSSTKVYNCMYIRPVVTIDKAELDRNNGVFKEYIIDENGFEDLSNNRYKTGDVINYRGVRFYVVNDNSEDNKEISLVKATPLTTSEVNTYGVGYINKFGDNKDTVIDKNGYGALAYFRNETCYNDYKRTGCINSFGESDISHIVDTWSRSLFNSSQINIDNLNMKFRLINQSDLYALDYKGTLQASDTSMMTSYIKPGIYNEDINLSSCWSSISYGDSNYQVGAADNENKFVVQDVYSNDHIICPVVTIKKNPLPAVELDEESDGEEKIIVNVPDTKLYKGIMIALSGFVIAGLSITLATLNKKGKRQ